jgi:hypothetical protein
MLFHVEVHLCNYMMIIFMLRPLFVTSIFHPMQMNVEKSFVVPCARCDVKR